MTLKRKIIKKTSIVDDDTPIVLKGKKAVLLAEACKLNKSKKAAEKRIKQIKVELGLTEAGEYRNEAKDVLVLSESAKFSDVDAKKLYSKFKAKKMISKYFSVVKVQIGELEKLMPKTIIAKLRYELDPITKWSFK